MARYTQPYRELLRQLEEVELLRRQAAGTERAQPVERRREIDALCRGSIVLLCGHLEGYVKALGEAALDSLTAREVPRESLEARTFFHISKDVLAEVQKATDPQIKAEKVFAFLDRDLSYWSRTGSFPQAIPTDRFSSGFANPGFGKVCKYFNRFGYSDYKHDLAARLGRNFQPTTNMVNHLVDTRNKIAHGDPGTSKTPTEVLEMVRLTRLFCVSTDDLFASWWKARFCSIRSDSAVRG